MAGGISNFLENKLIDHTIRGVNYPAPPSVFLALFTADSGLEANNPTAEVSGAGYARMEVGGSSGRSFTPAGTVTIGQTELAQDVEFPIADADWGTVTHYAVMDAATGGNVLWWGQLDNARTVLAGDALRLLKDLVRLSFI